MQEEDFYQAVGKICERDSRYARDAYAFLREALDFTVKALDKPTQGAGRHVTGKELAEGIRHYALQQFGPMTLRVFRTWGITSTGDFGELVFNMVSAKILGKTEQDSKEDFAGVYDFHEAFVKPFLPAKSRIRRPTASAPTAEGETPDPDGGGCPEKRKTSRRRGAS